MFMLKRGNTTYHTCTVDFHNIHIRSGIEPNKIGDTVKICWQIFVAQVFKINDTCFVLWYESVLFTTIWGGTW